MVIFGIILRNICPDQNIHQNVPNCTIFQNFLGGTGPRTPLPCTACNVVICIYTLLKKLSALLC